MTDRLLEALRKQRRRRLIKAGIAVAILIAAGAVVWMLWFSSLFAIEKVQVTGLEHGSRDAIVEAADVTMKQPLMRLDSEAVSRRVGEVSIVESAHVAKRWPHTVLIEVTERQAVAWIDRAGKPWAVDESGVIYRSLKDRPSHLPQLDVDARDRLVVEAAAATAGALHGESPNLAADVERIEAESRDSVVLYLTEGRTVVWGSAEQAAEKIVVLVPLMKIEATTYDVSAPERPTTAQAD